MNINIHFDFGCKLVREEAGAFGHTFGGDFPYKGTVPKGGSIPVHLLFRLDLFDPILPFRIVGGFRFLPLFYAFSYDGLPMSYRVRSDNEIEILGIENNEPTPDFPYAGFPRYFDLLPIRVEPITFQEQRDIAMHWYLFHLHYEIYKAIPADEIQRFKTLGYPLPRIGRVHDLLQRPRGEPCPNLGCRNHGVEHCLTTIATIPDKPFKDVDLCRYEGSVQIAYEICDACGSIRTYANAD